MGSTHSRVSGKQGVSQDSGKKAVKAEKVEKAAASAANEETSPSTSIPSRMRPHHTTDGVSGKEDSQGKMGKRFESSEKGEKACKIAADEETGFRDEFLDVYVDVEFSHNMSSCNPDLNMVIFDVDYGSDYLVRIAYDLTLQQYYFKTKVYLGCLDGRHQLVSHILGCPFADAYGIRSCLLPLTQTASIYHVNVTATFSAYVPTTQRHADARIVPAHRIVGNFKEEEEEEEEEEGWR